MWKLFTSAPRFETYWGSKKGPDATDIGPALTTALPCRVRKRQHDHSANSSASIAVPIHSLISEIGTVGVREMPKVEVDGLPVIDADESEQITVAVSADDMQAGDTGNPERHPVAIALRRKRDVDDARVPRSEVLKRRGDTWYRYDAPKLVQS